VFNNSSILVLYPLRKFKEINSAVCILLAYSFVSAKNFDLYNRIERLSMYKV